MRPFAFFVPSFFVLVIGCGGGPDPESLCRAAAEKRCLDDDRSTDQQIAECAAQLGMYEGYGQVRCDDEVEEYFSCLDERIGAIDACTNEGDELQEVCEAEEDALSKCVD